MFYDIILYIILITIFIQDIKYRAVSWFLIPLAIILLSVSQLDRYPFSLFFSNAVWCFCVLTIQLLGVTIYFRLRHVKPAEILRNKIGFGDLLIFILPCLLFSPLNYALFLTFVFAFSLLVYLIFLSVNKKTIPLAGYLSIILLLLHVFVNHITKINLYNNLPDIL